MRITPESVPEHATLENDVTNFLVANGFATASATYHDVMPKEMTRRLQQITQPTALYIRHRADRIAIHNSLDLVFEWEAKTHVSRQYHDMTIEVLPLIHHLAKAALDVRCLYVYRNTYHGHDVGFWVHDLPIIPIRCAMIPGRWRGTWFRGWIMNLVEQWLPGVPVVETRGNAGSGDPFIIIDEQVVSGLLTWESIIRAVVLP